MSFYTSFHKNVKEFSKAKGILFHFAKLFMLLVGIISTRSFLFKSSITELLLRHGREGDGRRLPAKKFEF